MQFNFKIRIFRVQDFGNYELLSMYNWYVHVTDPKIYIPKFCNLSYGPKDVDQ